MLHKSEGRLFYRYSTFFVVVPGQDCFLTVLKGEGGGGGGGTSPISQPIFFRNPTSQCSNPIPTSRIWKKSQCYTYHLFSLLIRKITASKYDPTETQKFTRIYKYVLKITGSFQTVINLSSSEFIAISPCHFTFLPFLPAGNLPSDLYVFLLFPVWSDGSCSLFHCLPLHFISFISLSISSSSFHCLPLLQSHCHCHSH